MTYGPSGAVRSTFFGNGLQESVTFNQRLQPVARQLFNGAQTLMDLRYGFNDIFTGANNGNVMKVDDVINPDRSRLYFYDKLNRLEEALGLPWSISYTYDRFGNRLSAQGAMSTPNYQSSSLMIDPSTNRILDAEYEYDAAGYVLRDPQRSYRWDAAGRLIGVAPSDQTPLDDGRCMGAGCPPPPDPPSGPGGPLDNGRSVRGRGAAGGSAQSVSYEYDYGGRRVIKRHEDGIGRIYFWDEVMGEVLWEFPLGGGQQDLVRGYFNGQLVVENDARGPGIHFFHRDHLGSTLMSTNFLSPTVVCDSFFHPFGQSADTTACDSHVRKFTGKERDPESSLDYFGACYYDKVAGRFLARDPLLASADLADPQTWNRYIYVRNRPMVFVDPDGRDPISAEECESNSNCIRLQLNVILDQDADIFDDDGNLRPRFQQLLDEQIAQARDELGAVGIYLDVIYSRGGVEGRRITSGTVDKALNYALSDSNNIRDVNFSGGAGVQQGRAVMLANMYNRSTVAGTLGHEISHHLSGDTMSVPSRILNAFFDTGHALTRWRLRESPAFSRVQVQSPPESGTGYIYTEHSWRRLARLIISGR